MKGGAFFAAAAVLCGASTMGPDSGFGGGLFRGPSEPVLPRSPEEQNERLRKAEAKRARKAAALAARGGL